MENEIVAIVEEQPTIIVEIDVVRQVESEDLIIPDLVFIYNLAKV